MWLRPQNDVNFLDIFILISYTMSKKSGEKSSFYFLLGFPPQKTGGLWSKGDKSANEAMVISAHTGKASYLCARNGNGYCVPDSGGTA